MSFQNPVLSFKCEPAFVVKSSFPGNCLILISIEYRFLFQIVHSEISRYRHKNYVDQGVEENAPYSDRWNETFCAGGKETFLAKFTLVENTVTNLQHLICKTF